MFLNQTGPFPYLPGGFERPLMPQEIFRVFLRRQVRSLGFGGHTQKMKVCHYISISYVDIAAMKFTL